jgi:DNA-binding GntR family transcriptional regulator
MGMAKGIHGYRDLSRLLLEQIESGEYVAGDRLPTETAMSQAYGINRHTVRAALQLLEAEGYITRIRGKGTFVTRIKIPYAISPTSSFTASVERMGINGTCRVLHANVLPASDEVRRRLHLSGKSRIVVLEILRCVDDVPTCVTTSYLSHERFRDLAERAPGMDSLYSLLREHYGVAGIRRAWSEIEAVLPESRDREHLQMPASMPLLITRSLVKDGNGDRLEYCISRNRSDAYTLRVNLEPTGDTQP